MSYRDFLAFSIFAEFIPLHGKKQGIIHCACGSLMKHTCSSNHGLVYRYYTCYNQVKYKNCPSQHKNIPAEPVERSVIEEVLKIIKSPEVVINLNRLAEQRKDLRKDDLMTALKNLNEAWSYLYQAEQTKIVKILVERVEIKENGIKLDLNLDGFDNLFVELAS
ncbi:MAG: zinc ribbon domain-containing protein [Holosporaceae bacterium]|nr:zinc ribbon domain-containing protein [Holosporaceae bacterium]